MMSLVSYENSDSEEESNEDVNNEEDLESKPIIEKDIVNIFEALPQPAKRTTLVVEEDDDFLKKKEVNQRTKIKITVPSLSEFNDIKEVAPKAKIWNAKNSSLLNILPKPKYSGESTVSSKSFIPNVLKQKGNQPAHSTATLTKPKQIIRPSDSSNTNHSDGSDNEDDGTTSDFFSMNTPQEPIVPCPVTIGALGLSKIGVQSTTSVDYTVDDAVVQENHQYLTEPQTHDDDCERQNSYLTSVDGSDSIVTETQNVSNDLELDDEAIRQLCGSRGRRKKEEIQIVSVDQKEVLGDSRDWLVKGLMDDTSKRVSASKRKGNEPTSQQKRKHQITYLAHQAKANEVELQNQWANNRLSRRQTQSKYGF